MVKKNNMKQIFIMYRSEKQKDKNRYYFCVYV